MSNNIIRKAYEWLGGALGVRYDNGFRWLWGGTPTRSGINVDGQSALRTIAVQRCVSLLSGTLASAPIYGYAAGKQKQYVQTPLDVIFNRRSNPEWSAMKYRSYLWQSVLLHGAHYAKIIRNARNEVIALWPLPAASIQRKVSENGNVYFEQSLGGKLVQYPSEAIFYVPYLITDWLGNGLSVIEAHAEDIGASQAARAHGASWFRQGARMSGVLKIPTKLSDEAYERLRTSWAEQYGGAENAHKPAILEQGLEFSPLSVKPSDSQLLETCIQSDEQIAMMYGIPPSMIGLTAKSTSWGSGIAEQVLGWQKFTVGPLGALLASEAQVQLIPRLDVDLRHDFSELLKPDFKTIVEAVGNAHRGGLLTANEGREMLDYDPHPDGDKLLVQMQMVPIADAGKNLTGGASDAPDTTV